MAGRIPEKFIDDLLARIDIVDVIQERLPLKKAGKDWSARCPFHDERSASFTVSQNKQFYHCFGCGAHGSAIGFLMNYDRLEFPDAIEELASRVGLQVPYEGGRAAPREDATDLYELLDAVTAFYRRQLGEHAAARRYFAERGLDDAILARFRLGYAPEGWDTLKNALGSSAQRVALLEKTGMLTSGERGSKYDRFRDRVMFPILDRRGRTIAFGGRILAAPKPSPKAAVDDNAAAPADAAEPAASGADGGRKGEGPKYLNSPETPLFHKGRELFGLWQVRDAHSKIPRLIVVEGYMDVISLHQFGVTQAVATLGTATTRDHAEILFRQCADVFFCFDGDRAGRQAAWRALESVLPRLRDGRQAAFLFLPDGEDPDSVVRKEGLEGFEQRLKQATPLSEFLFGELGRGVNLASLDGKARLAERARPLLAQIPDGAFRDLMFGELERISGVHTASAPTPAADTRRPARPAQRSVVRAAITLLVQRPSLALETPPPWPFEDLRQPGVPLLLELIELGRSRAGLSTGALLEHYAGREEARALQKLAMSDDFPGDEAAALAEFRDALAQLERQKHQQRIDDLLQRQAEGGLAEAEKDELRQLLVARR